MNQSPYSVSSLLVHEGGPSRGGAICGTKCSSGPYPSPRPEIVQRPVLLIPFCLYLSAWVVPVAEELSVARNAPAASTRVRAGHCPAASTRARARKRERRRVNCSSLILTASCPNVGQRPCSPVAKRIDACVLAVIARPVRVFCTFFTL